MKLKANAASVESTLGGGSHGLLGLTVSTNTYNTITGQQFAAPQNPGALPVIPDGATSAQINELVRQHGERLRIWREYNITSSALKQLLLKAFDEMYFKGIRDRHVGYNNVTLLQMIQHLYTNYGVITPSDLADNDARMRETFDATKPVEELFQQIEDAVEYAEAAEAPYNDTQIVSRAYLLLLNTGMYNQACREWRRKPTVEQTWTAFKTFFAEVHRDLLAQRAMQTNPYQEANAVIEAFQEQTDKILDKLTQPTTDATTISTLTSHNEAMASQLANATMDLSEMKNLVTMLCQQVNDLQNAPAQKTRKYRPNRNKNNKSYCWTHGRTRRNDHTSATCRNKAEGNIDTATLEDRQSGSSRFCDEIL